MQMPSGLSPSSLDLWEQCPRRYKQEKILRREGGTSLDAVLGTFVHEVLERLMQLPPKLRTPASARALAGEIWPSYRDGGDSEIIAADDEAALDFRRRAWGSVRRYFTIEAPEQAGVVATESKVEAEIEGVPVRGIIDRLDRDVFGDYVVIDYKAGKVPAPRFRSQKFRQLNIYGLLVRAMTKEAPAEGRLIFTTYGQVITTPFTDRSLNSAATDLATAWAEITEAFEADDFAPSPGPLCGWCPFAAECPEGIADLQDRRARGKLRVDAPAYALAEAS